MSFWLVLLIALAAALIIAAIIRCIWELHTLSVNRYEIKSSDIRPENAVKAVFLSDLHGRVYGEDNIRLIEMIKKEDPDVIFLGGDIYVNRDTGKDINAVSFLKQVSRIAPVYMAQGNHEKGMQSLKMFKKRYKHMTELLDELGIVFLKNTSADINDDITVAGLDVAYKYYDKVHPHKMTADILSDYLGTPDKDKFNIVLAHNPKYFDLYADTGYDLFLSGHLHGGAVRLPGLGGVVSPQFKLFPKYSKGRFEKNGVTMIVTGGAGSHTVNLRLFNKPEIVVLNIKSEVE